MAAPAIASELEHIKIDPKVILKDYKKMCSCSDCTVVEGLDGLMIPVSQDCMFSDVIKMFNLPLLFVIDVQMSNIDSILTSINQTKSEGIKVAGVVLNKFPQFNHNTQINSLPRLIEEYSDVKVLGIIRQFAPDKRIEPSLLISEVLNGLDIEKIFNVPLPKLNPGM